MLIQLAIRDIVLIERLDLDFSRGLSILTGETGAGKSILLDSFLLALGGRGDGGLVRTGATQGQVTALFDLPMDHAARVVAASSDIDVDGDLILRRVQMADGRTRAFVNDQPVSVQVLRAIGSQIVEIHGQHDDRAMIDPAVHRSLLDSFGALNGTVDNVRAAHSEMKRLRADVAAESARLAKARADADWLRHAHEELATLDAQPDEEDSLAAQRLSMQQAEKVAADLRDAYEHVSGDNGPGRALNSTLRQLSRRASLAPALIEPSMSALGTALDALDVASSTLEAALRACDFDPRELERVEERLFALRGAGRKYQTPVAALPALAERYAGDLAALAASETQLVKLQAQSVEADQIYADLAVKLSKARKATARKLDAAVDAELGPLKLERAKFNVRVDDDASAQGADGIDRVEFWVQTNPGTRPGPLMKVASGGELARFMLALKVVLADRGSAPTLVFDEIDTGVGGAVADAIGQRLARLAERVQVLAVTHAPQVAARAALHFRIAKAETSRGARVATQVAVLEPAERREEIARMLAGASVTEEARAAAGRLLASALDAG